MTITINALDNEFAASSGTNIDVTDDFSYFDHPPNSTSDLTITSNVGDDSPFIFSVGDTYDLTWSGNGGGGIMEDAVVVRSDYLGPGQGAIVFEGINSVTGEPFQMVWTPDFDLEQWYWDNGGGPSTPNAFWTSDTNTSETYQAVCFAAGTSIATSKGLVLVENLCTGDEVLTIDNGPCPVLWVGKRTLLGAGASAPVVFEAGTIGNDRRLVVSQNHRIMLASPWAELYFAEHEVFVPAKALVNGINIYTETRQQVSYHHILLASHEVLLAEGAPCESMFLGDVALARLNPAAKSEVAQYLAQLDAHQGEGRAQVARLDLSFKQARLLAVSMGITNLEMPRAVPSCLIAC